MKATMFVPLLVGAQIALVSAAAFAAPGDAPANRVRGQVTKVDATAKSITITDRRTQSDTTFTVDDSTKYTVSALGSISDLKVGDNVRVMGQLSGNTVSAMGIMVVNAPRPNAANAPARPGRGVQGVVATVTPNLTITTPDNQTDTVTTTADTRVLTTHPGTFADVATGVNVNAMLNASNVATRVQVQPAGLFGGRRQGRAQ